MSSWAAKLPWLILESRHNGEDYERLPDREQAVILYDDDMHVTVVQPNEDGSYWRKIVRNKVVRMKEKRREAAAMRFLERNYKIGADSKSTFNLAGAPTFQPVAQPRRLQCPVSRARRS